MKLKSLYLVFAAIGFVAPYYFFIRFLADHGLDLSALVRQLFGSNISSFFAVDLIVSSLVFVIFLWKESARQSLRHWWWYLLPLCTVGLSFALPLFLYARERRLELHRAE